MLLSAHLDGICKSKRSNGTNQIQAAERRSHSSDRMGRRIDEPARDSGEADGTGIRGGVACRSQNPPFHAGRTKVLSQKAKYGLRALLCSRATRQARW